MEGDEFYTADPAVIITALIWLGVAIAGAVWLRAQDNKAYPGLPLFRNPKQRAAADRAGDSDDDSVTQGDVNRRAEADFAALIEGSRGDREMMSVSAVAPLEGDGDDMPDADALSPSHGARNLTTDSDFGAMVVPGAVDPVSGLPQLRSVDSARQGDEAARSSRMSRFNTRHSRFARGGMGSSEDDPAERTIGSRVAVEALAFAPGDDSTDDTEEELVDASGDVVGHMVLTAHEEVRNAPPDDEADLWGGLYGDQSGSFEDGEDEYLRPGSRGQWTLGGSVPGTVPGTLETAMAAAAGGQASPDEDRWALDVDEGEALASPLMTDSSGVSDAFPVAPEPDLTAQLFGSDAAAGGEDGDSDTSDALSTVRESDGEDDAHASPKHAGAWRQ